jgi:hypothetical protein
LYSRYNDNDLITETLTTASYRYHEQGLEYQLYREILFKISIPYACKLVFYKIKEQGKILVIPKVDFALLQQSYFIKLANKSKKNASIAIRKYQSQYRDRIIARDKMCIITSIETLQVCEASHLKPYCRCTEKEQSNPINGILLSATFHKFLDEGLISFDPNTGKIILSRFLPTRDKIWLKENTATFISLKDIQEIEHVYKNMKPFIKYHYDHVFLSD